MIAIAPAKRSAASQLASIRQQCDEVLDNCVGYINKLFGRTTIIVVDARFALGDSSSLVCKCFHNQRTIASHKRINDNKQSAWERSASIYSHIDNTQHACFVHFPLCVIVSATPLCRGLPILFNHFRRSEYHVRRLSSLPQRNEPSGYIVSPELPDTNLSF